MTLLKVGLKNWHKFFEISFLQSIPSKNNNNNKHINRPISFKSLQFHIRSVYTFGKMHREGRGGGMSHEGEGAYHTHTWPCQISFNMVMWYASLWKCGTAGDGNCSDSTVCCSSYHESTLSVDILSWELELEEPTWGRAGLASRTFWCLFSYLKTGQCWQQSKWLIMWCQRWWTEPAEQSVSWMDILPSLSS